MNEAMSRIAAGIPIMGQRPKDSGLEIESEEESGSSSSGTDNSDELKFYKLPKGKLPEKK